MNNREHAKIFYCGREFKLLPRLTLENREKLFAKYEDCNRCNFEVEQKFYEDIIDIYIDQVYPYSDIRSGEVHK